MREQPVLRRRRFFQGRRLRGAEVKDIMWLTPDGREIRTARRARKSAAGYDLTRLLVAKKYTPEKIVRTGEASPYANVILISGVTF